MDLPSPNKHVLEAKARHVRQAWRARALWGIKMYNQTTISRLAALNLWDPGLSS